ncbi:hypothetical protein CCC_03378 [Paramagnetospirillum magnetotacticum MS-1]|uniref:Uncharacterized protein n=1 Tax=Paramagnetospirillum magnetotacticum MS-1 TaxID=272627 RepID=A0A0C2YWV6_PARME|nr:hypothetical protein [Paramagnetospirillum magnetotacticum]KIL99160.1 hypothetical protein CCC_03378 [Paramagnetospirillum magnetotacticum MS-1]
MVESTRGFGSSVLNTALSGVFGRDQRASVAAGGGEAVTAIQGATPAGPRGRRMLSPNTSVDSLDRNAPRGTYLDILA